MVSHLRLLPALSDPDSAWSAESPIRVVLADDHVPVRRVLRQLLDGEEHIEVIGEADDVISIEHQVQLHQPHVLVLDLSLHSGSTDIAETGIQRRRAPHTEIVCMTMDDDPILAQWALRAGAVGFVCKEFADEELALAIRTAARGERFISPRVAARLYARCHTRCSKRYDTARRVSDGAA